MAETGQPIVFPDRDRDRSYIGKFSEVISQVKMKTSTGADVVIDMENTGEIHVMPWTSDDEPGAMFGTSEDRAIFCPVSGHDVMVLELMAEHARKFKAVVDAEQEAIDKQLSTLAPTGAKVPQGEKQQQESFRLVHQ